MTAWCLWLALLPRVDLDRALALCAAGDFPAARAAADEEADPLRRAQALVHVHRSAGDLFGAERETRAALRWFPDDPWLLEQHAALAITVGDATAARERCARLVARGGAGNTRAAALAVEAEDLASAERGAVRALGRARIAVALQGLAVVIALASAARASRRRA